MQSNDEKRVPTMPERDEARTRLARQIGRLLAHEWLRNRTTRPPESSAAAPISDDKHPNPSTTTSEIFSS